MKKLLVIDMQKGFINENNEFLIKNIENLLKNRLFDKIIATKFINCENSQYEKYLDWKEMQGGEQTEFALQFPENTTVIEKCSYGLPVEKLKDFSANDEVYLCGTDYDACVLAIGYQLFDQGVCVKFIQNAIGSSSSTNRNKTLDEIVVRNFGENALVKI